MKPNKGTCMGKYARISMIVIATVGAGSVQAANMSMREITPGNTGWAGWEVTDINIDPGEFRVSRGNIKPAQSGLKTVNRYGKRATCASPPMSAQPGDSCVGRSAPTGTCDTNEEASALAKRYLGTGIQISKTNTEAIPAMWSWYCVSSSRRELRDIAFAAVNTVSAPVSCSSSSLEFRLLGRVGARVTDTQDAIIHCESEATIRLSIPDEGRVTLVGEGEVKLKFPNTGGNELKVTGTDLLIRIDGELTKSPTTAGTYRGSTVLLLDVL